jgi:hypothetical protein
MAWHERDRPRVGKPVGDLTRPVVWFRVMRDRCVGFAGQRRLSKATSGTPSQTVSKR